MVKYLIIRFSSIGDIVLTTPLIRCLKQQVEGAEVHFLTKEQYGHLLESNPYLDKIHILHDNSQETIKELKIENFDYILDLQNNIRSLNIKRSLKRMYFTVDKLNFKKWLLVNFRINKLPKLHIVDRYLETAEVFDVTNDGMGLDYYIPEESVVHPDSLPEPYRNGYIALVIGARHATKRVPAEQIIQLTRLIKHPLLLIGGKEDHERGEEILNASPDTPISNTCGLYTIHQSASLIRQSNCVITNDTGMMHIAAAFKKRIITIWGNTVPEFGMSAYMPDPANRDFEVTNLSCRPCSKLGFEKCPKKHFNCMIGHDLNAIAAAANSLF